MKKLIVIFMCLVIMLICGCGKFDRSVAGITGYSKICVDGVEYIQFTSGASVSYTTDGKIKICK